jgi:hypothetical protein
MGMDLKILTMEEIEQEAVLWVRGSGTRRARGTGDTACPPLPQRVGKPVMPMVLQEVQSRGTSFNRLDPLVIFMRGGRSHSSPEMNKTPISGVVVSMKKWPRHG